MPASPATSLRRTDVALVSAGHGGMSILLNLLAILTVFFYLPPESEGLPQLVTDRTILAVLNAIVLVAAAGRLTDAITDPLVASWSDRCRHPDGRRVPFMRWGVLPAVVTTALMFLPPVESESGWNIVWLLAVQVVLFVALTAYVTPAFSLVADLGRTPEERLDLATWTTVAWALGIVIAATTPFLSSMFQSMGWTPIRSWQAGVVIVCVIALVFMWLPVQFLDEPSLARSEPTSLPIRESLRVVFSNDFFRYYVAADFAYFCGLAIIQTGLLYYLTVLLEMDGALTAPLLLVMVIVALFLYPVVNRLAKRLPGKPLVVGAFIASAVDFIAIIFLGRFPFQPWLQALAIIIIFSVPFAVLSVLPQWILSDIAEHASLTTGNATVAMFFAARTFMQKIGSTVGVVIFALLASLGRDVGDDLGIRLSGLAGVVLYATAGLLFSRYDEDRLRRELAS